MVGASRRSGDTGHPVSDARGEALAALQLWQTFEYLSPQNPPKPEIGTGVCVWMLNPSASGDAEMPWRDAAKIETLDRLFRSKRRYLLFAGVIKGDELVEAVRRFLGASELDFTEQRPPANAASFVIPIDEYGQVSGEVFVSTVPWAIARIEAAQGQQGLFDFSGFFGDDGVQQRVKDAVDALLKQRQLLQDPSIENAPDVRAEDGGSDAQADASEAPGTAGAAADAAAPTDRRTLDAADVRAIADVVFTTCGWHPASDAGWIIQTLKAPTKNQEKAADDPLNSFYAEELEKIQGEYLAGRSGKALSQFLETPIPEERCDLAGTREHLIDGVHPSRTPAACWPGKHPLVMAQQFAVNTILRELQEGGLFSVNGPPGTGKTTMLKDILAAVVLQRADALALFKQPNDAFSGKLTVERHDYPIWKIDDRLRDFGIVVACANNGAAENISKELPGLAAIDPAVAIDYFSEVADSIGLPKEKKQREHRRWGLVSAALGKQENRLAFAADFWEGRRDPANDKKGTKKTAPDSGSAPAAEPPDPLRPLTLRNWIAEFGSGVPRWEEARQRYAEARARADAALRRAGTLVGELGAARQLAMEIDELDARQARLHGEQAHLKPQMDAAQAAAGAAQRHKEQTVAIAEALHALRQHEAGIEQARAQSLALQQRKPPVPVVELDESIARVEHARRRVKEDCDAHSRVEPGFFAAIFDRARARHWAMRHGQLQAELDAQRNRLDELEREKESATRWQRDIDSVEQKLNTLPGLKQSAQAVLTDLGASEALSPEEATAQSQAARQVFEQCRSASLDLQHKATHLAREIQTRAATIEQKKQTLARHQTALKAAGSHAAHRTGWNLFDGSREDFHRASPYHDEEIFHARRDLFAAAMELHKAFIVHSWRRLQTTLYAAVAMLQGKLHPNQIQGGPMPLWDALFLVVPLVSTTFASFPRLFRGVGKEQLAWVLIDEAGQASPQYCAGALWRARRAVVVGDPLQLEPVVGVPEELVAPLRVRCGADPRYVPPRASAQTLADLSNRYGLYLRGNDLENRIWLGAPLVVHRRCIDPMFAIANAIAYENTMVYGGGKEKPGEAAAASHWLDLPADGNETHWIPEQGRRAIRLVKELVGDRLRDEEGKLRAFVITPFRKVAEKMGKLLTDELGADARGMCGTVHTFQGKEADYVVFLLGGDPKNPAAISNFAGKNPNLVNVAVTRARTRLYVVGNRDYWTGRGDANGYYRYMAELLDEHRAETKTDSRSPLRADVM